MLSADWKYPAKVEIIDGQEVVIEEAKIIRTRSCPKCGWRHKTTEAPIGEGWQGPKPTISKVRLLELVADDNTPRLF